MADGSEIEPRHALSADELEERAWSTATVKAYRSDWADWEGWARGRNRQLFPALPADVAEYLADLSRRAKASTIGRRLSAIAWRHASENVPFAWASPARSAAPSWWRSTSPTSNSPATASSC